MLHQLGNILTTIRQLRQMHPDHIQPVIEILTETVLFNQGLQILVSCSDYSHIHLYRGMSTDPVELTVRQHPQQSGLGLGGHIANFIQEQCAAVGLLKASLTALCGAGKGPFFMAKQFRLNQVMGNRRHIQRDKFRTAARAVFVQSMGNQLLTCTGLTIDQDCDIGVGEATNSAKHLLHSRCFTNNFLDWLGINRLFDRFLLPGKGNAATGYLDQFIEIKGLWQILKGTALVGSYCTVQVRVGGGDNDRYIGPCGVDLLEQFQAIDTRHTNIGDNDFRFRCL